MAVHKRCCNKILSKCEGNAESSQSTIVSSTYRAAMAVIHSSSVGSIGVLGLF